MPTKNYIPPISAKTIRQQYEIQREYCYLPNPVSSIGNNMPHQNICQIWHMDAIKNDIIVSDILHLAKQPKEVSPRGCEGAKTCDSTITRTHPGLCIDLHLLNRNRKSQVKKPNSYRFLNSSAKNRGLVSQSLYFLLVTMKQQALFHYPGCRNPLYDRL